MKVIVEAHEHRRTGFWQFIVLHNRVIVGKSGFDYPSKGLTLQEGNKWLKSLVF